MSIKKANFHHRGYTYSPMMKMRDDGEIIHYHDIYHKKDDSNVVFVYWGIVGRPLTFDEFSRFVDKMIITTESGY